MKADEMMSAPIGSEFDPSGTRAVRPKQRIHLVLLGVESVSRSARFYESLGWKRSVTSNDGFVKFNLGGYALCLISRADFAADARATTSEGLGFSGVALIYLAGSPDEVPEILDRASKNGGTLVKPATRTPWGVAGYFKDPDGHLFEVDYEESWVFDDDHHLVVDQRHQDDQPS